MSREQRIRIDGVIERCRSHHERGMLTLFCSRKKLKETKNVFKNRKEGEVVVAASKWQKIRRKQV